MKNVNEPTNGAADIIGMSQPYCMSIEITGNSDILWHRWNCEAVEAKASAAKNSKAKKTDDLESYVWRNEHNELCLPGEYLRQAIIHAAKFKQDPRSPRKSAMDLYKAGLVSLTHLASLGSDNWDYEHKCRVVIQRAAVNRIRPASKQGWKATINLMVLTPEYISEMDLHDTITTAGRLIGVGDFRPTFGRFGITKYEKTYV